MSDLEKYRQDGILPESCMMAIFLHDHPDQVVRKGKTLFRYSPLSDCFLYRTPGNKRRYGWYKARGLSVWFRLAQQMLAENVRLNLFHGEVIPDV